MSTLGLRLIHLVSHGYLSNGDKLASQPLRMTTHHGWRSDILGQYKSLSIFVFSQSDYKSIISPTFSNPLDKIDSQTSTTIRVVASFQAKRRVVCWDNLVSRIRNVFQLPEWKCSEVGDNLPHMDLEKQTSNIFNFTVAVKFMIF